MEQNVSTDNVSDLEPDTEDNTDEHNDIEMSEEKYGIYQVTLPPMKERIEYRNIGEENWNECVVIGRAGKVGKARSGKHKILANVKRVNDGCMKSVNFDNVEWIFKEESVMLSQSFDYDVMTAQEIEVHNVI